MPKLIDQRTGEERELLKPVTLIGRAEYCDICVPERTVSREHARIQRRLTGYYIEDLGSRHGTRLNDVRIHRRAKLRDGDVITVPATRPEGQPTTSLRLPHTDTTELSRREQPLAVEDLLGPESTPGASFVFRR
jgi:pSer/pThr/pTyr-binding forkhead associated (FHA) protein